MKIHSESFRLFARVGRELTTMLAAEWERWALPVDVGEVKVRVVGTRRQ